MNKVVGICTVFLSLTASVRGGETCLIRSNYNYYFEECPEKCCGEYLDKYCCDYDYDWVIPVIVVSCIVFASIVGCCICVCVCVCANKGKTRGTVVQPAGTNSTITTIAYSNPGQTNYGYQPAPPAYSQHPPSGYNQHPPPAYNQHQGYSQYPPLNVPGMPLQDPAYPPPMSNQPPTATGNANNNGKT